MLISLKKKLKKIIVTNTLLLLFVIILIASLAAYEQNAIISAFKSDNDYSVSAALSGTGNIALSQRVLAYRDSVTQYATQYNIADYVNLLLAIMQQESGGQGNDVFQCSESLGLAPNSISTSASIEQGVRVFSNCLTKSGCTSPTDINKIKLALQGYNFGSSYINFALDREGMWTQDNTNAFAEKQSGGAQRVSTMASKLGVWAYGDQYYTSHVLRYYSYTVENTDGVVVVTVAEQQIGKPYVWGATGPDSFDCSGLVYYVYKQTGKYNGGRLTAAGFRSVAMNISEQDAIPGDLVFFTNSKGVVHHVAIYAGNGMMIEAPHTGANVRFTNVIGSKGDMISYGRI